MRVRPVVGAFMVAAALAASGPSTASARVFVGEMSLNCGGGCLGPAALKYKPTTLWLREQNEGGIYAVRLTGLKWTRWGGRTATGRGRVRHGDPDNGTYNDAVTVTLSRITRAGCSDEAGRFRAYNRASIRAGGESARVIAKTVWTPLLAC
ncbi:hypothetical protein C8N24_0738 [Solirubrobacter pauli]|uniref:Secreted protein n=1 Tax=Solirubrobacter pauli TaxID=166793 RepID=A0A660LAM0_9ACTN|nr:hypothetical protein C8N24_0738 [Solirubrobacter pauli]